MKDLCHAIAVAAGCKSWLNGHGTGSTRSQQEQNMGSGRLTTHVLDTARGKPAGGVRVQLFRVTGMKHSKIAETETNADGRTDGPLLQGDKLVAGIYELIFFAGDYLRATGQVAEEVLFLDQIPIRFGVPDADQHYHVPLLVSPYSYSTYRGS
jgi:5-hydroxyisourate hydrolase